MLNKKINIMDLFCGTGGLSYGFTKYSKQFETVCAIDILESSLKTAQLNHPEAIVINQDIRTLKPSDVESLLKENNKSVDVIVGGPPCQGFSSIRPFRNDNDDDPRNNLFEQYALFVNYFKPYAFVLENVVGLATHKNSETIKTIEKCFEEIGYDVNWKIVNAANFGVPQKRERVIMIGVKKGLPILFPEPTHYFEGKTIGYNDKSKVISAVNNLFSFDAYEPAITVAEAISDLPPIESGQTASSYTMPPQNNYQQERRGDNDTLELHSSTNHSPKMLEIIKHSGSSISCIPKHLISSGFSTSYSRLEANKPANTLTVNFVHPASNKCIHPFQNRALTPREGARIQGFDDNFKFYGSRTQIVKQIGNAVPPLLGKAIAKGVYEIFKETSLTTSK
ncbi:DNA cytosine methyltransferase [Alkalicoccus chagannorensis]|uniref:DNA cytosine methyltransferase n=1 Tax=Alkalicoccus chagannorensis TaxID=427072 RepID=UPI0003FE4684|nr:DNA cytosine methyltransferase [Alkalicoccus chagannorensis]